MTASPPSVTRKQRVANCLSAAEDCRLAGQRPRQLQFLQLAFRYASGRERQSIQAQIDALSRPPAPRRATAPAGEED